MSTNSPTMVFDVTVEQEELSNGEKIYVASCHQVDIASQGVTVEEAKANLAEALTLWLETASQSELENSIPEFRRNLPNIYITRIEVPYGQTPSVVGR